MQFVLKKDKNTCAVRTLKGQEHVCSSYLKRTRTRDTNLEDIIILIYYLIIFTITFDQHAKRFKFPSLF